MKMALRSRPHRLGRSGAVLGADVRRQFRLRRRHRRPDGVPVRHELGALLGVRRAASSARRWRWKACSRFFSRRVPRPARLRREAPGPARALPGRGRAVRRKLAFRLLHRLHERVHAAPRRARLDADGTLFWRTLGVPPEPVGHRAVRAHDDRLRRDGVVRDRRPRRVLHVARRAHASCRESVSALRRPRRARRGVLVAFPTGDHQAKLVARHQPVALAAMEGRFESGPHVPDRLIGQPNVRERRIDNAIVAPGLLSILAFGTSAAQRSGAQRLSSKTGRQHRASLLLVSRHGRSRNVVHRAHGARDLSSSSQATR